MAVPTIPNAIALTAIQTEFGGSGEIRLSEYYNDATPDLVPSGTTNATGVVVPNIGNALRFSNFSGAAVFTPYTDTYTSGTGTVTAPAGATQCVIKMWGGGGGGNYGGAPAITGLGGGGGGFIKKTVSVTGGVTQLIYTVGTGGSIPGGQLANSGTYSEVLVGGIYYYANGGDAASTTNFGTGGGIAASTVPLGSNLTPVSSYVDAGSESGFSGGVGDSCNLEAGAGGSAGGVASYGGGASDTAPGGGGTGFGACGPIGPFQGAGARGEVRFEWS